MTLISVQRVERHPIKETIGIEGKEKNEAR